MEMLAKNAAENLKGLNVSQEDYLEPVENDGNFINGFPSLKSKKTTSSAHITDFDSFEEAIIFNRFRNENWISKKEKHRKEDGFIYDNGTNLKCKIHSFDEIKSDTSWHCLGGRTIARLAVCYVDITDKNTEKYVVAYL